MKLNRRQFLTTGLAGAGGMFLGCSQLGLPHGGAAATDPFKRVALGNTGLRPSLIGMGTGMKGGKRVSDLIRQGDDKCVGLLRYAFDRGIRFFDCADTYGSHPYLARALRGIPREQYIVSSKIWVRPGSIPEPERLDADVIVDRFRKELNTDYLDMVLIHCMIDADWTDKQKRQMDILAGLKSKGIIRAHGVSVHSLAAMQACVTCPWVDSVHVRINAYGSKMDDADPAKVVEVLKQVHAAGKGVIGMKLIGEGTFRNDPEKINRSLEYVLGLGCVDMLIVGFITPQELDDYAARTRRVLEARPA